MTMNGAVLPLLAFYIVAATRARVSLKTTFQEPFRNGYLWKNLLVQKLPLQSTPPAPSIANDADIFLNIRAKKCRTFKLVLVVFLAYHIARKQVATAEIELPYTLADGLEYI